MQWHLLNQHYVSLGFENFGISVLEEVLSSDLTLVLLLVSGTVSQKTMNSVGQAKAGFSLTGVTGLLLV